MNEFEQEARRKKVTACMHVIDSACRESGNDPFRDADIVATLIENQSLDSWRALEQQAGVKRMSQTSRRELVAVYTTRAEENEGCPIV